MPTVFDALPAGYPEVPTVGRLDKDTTGLLIFTDDGGLAKRLTHRSGVAKVYVLDVAGVPPGAATLPSAAAQCNGHCAARRADCAARSGK